MNRIHKRDVAAWVASYLEALIAYENRPEHPLAALMATYGGTSRGPGGRSKPPINDKMTAMDRRVHRTLQYVKEINPDWERALTYYAACGSLRAVAEELRWSSPYARKNYDEGYACFRGVWALI